MSVQVRNIDTVATPTAGENYLLICDESGAENLNPTISYRWIKNSGTQVGGNSNTLFFTPLRLSDAASYVCEVTISSVYLTGDIVVMNINPRDIRIPSEFCMDVDRITVHSMHEILYSPSSIISKVG